MTLTTHEMMLTWVSLVHAGSYLPAALSQHLQTELGISLAEQDLLKQLGISGGELRLVDLAQRIYLSKAGVTKMMDRLESAGLVKRIRSTTDRRVIMARLTEKGKMALERSRVLLLAWVEANLSAHLSDQQMLALGEGLRSLLEGHGRWEGQMAHLAGGGSV